MRSGSGCGTVKVTILEGLSTIERLTYMMNKKKVVWQQNKCEGVHNKGMSTSRGSTE